MKSCHLCKIITIDKLSKKIINTLIIIQFKQNKTTTTKPTNSVYFEKYSKSHLII